MLLRHLAAIVGGLALATSLAVPPVRAAATTTVFGVITSTQGSPPDTLAEHVRLYEAHRARYGGGPIGIRVFSPDAVPLPTDNDRAGRLLTWAADRHPDEMITISHRDRGEARLRTLLDWVQARKLRVTVMYRHEAQGDWFVRGLEGSRPDVYRAVYRSYRAVIDAHPARDRVTLEKNLLWWYQRYHATAQSDWRHFVERDDPADLLSWDAYSFPGMPAGQGHYATPDDFFRYARDAWKEFRLPWAVGEIGTIVQDGTGTGTERDWDRHGTRFTAWVRQVADAVRDPASIGPSYAGMPAARYLNWWGAVDAKDRDLSLEQVPAAVTYYRSLVRNTPA
ncbi:hypothetical protein [Actinoplanes sp. G11-F43]|uniref:hypothetical protein n=1 Tax=Actinoplanes sp. G11-F43 TaxID=3424130 RepID=UPI003D34EA5E